MTYDKTRLDALSEKVRSTLGSRALNLLQPQANMINNMLLNSLKRRSPEEITPDEIEGMYEMAVEILLPNDLIALYEKSHPSTTKTSSDLDSNPPTETSS
jgi:hypothetical protein